MITKLYEYTVTKNTEETKFLDQVREENPDMITRFRSLVINKGLAVAKEKYKEFDPAEIKKRAKEDKKQTHFVKRQNELEGIKKHWSDVIDYISKSLEDEPLITMLFEHPFIGFNNTKEKNDFKTLLKNIPSLNKKIKDQDVFPIETLTLIRKNKNRTMKQDDKIVIRKYFSPSKFFVGDFFARNLKKSTINAIIYKVQFDIKEKTIDKLNLYKKRNALIHSLNDDEYLNYLNIEELNEKLNDFEKMMKPEFLDQLQREEDAEKFGI